jgi:hypothetical protein
MGFGISSRSPKVREGRPRDARRKRKLDNRNRRPQPFVLCVLVEGHPEHMRSTTKKGFCFSEKACRGMLRLELFKNASGKGRVDGRFLIVFEYYRIRLKKL